MKGGIVIALLTLQTNVSRMSYMNHLEKKLRYSNAFSSLNALRNRINFDFSSGIEPVERGILLDAMEIATAKSEDSFRKALMYGFFNTGDSVKTSALELAKVINSGLELAVLTREDIISMQKMLEPEAPIDISLKMLIPKIDSLMVLLNKAQREDEPGSSLSLIKS